ncbi:hypothetical protein HJG60_009735 [Phyllostomus discolor]|uniref:Uncharacterized protein n=1 Tax=Phyllostomus discolor TaxID=89673 RepID=A0A834ESY4_9CHIR|nr:hypothetical protein HJG60_009735 [Phyllostomus discolor]
MGLAEGQHSWSVPPRAPERKELHRAGALQICTLAGYACEEATQGQRASHRKGQAGPPLEFTQAYGGSCSHQQSRQLGCWGTFSGGFYLHGGAKSALQQRFLWSHFTNLKKQAAKISKNFQITYLDPSTKFMGSF